MKLNVFLVLCLFAFVGNVAIAQDDATITDDELKRYAVMMDSINNMSDALLADIKGMVEKNENMRVDRYNDLTKIIEDEAKLAEVKATPEEITFVKDVQAKKDEGTKKINETFKTMAKEYVGASSYNKIRKALKSDPTVKAKYETILAEVEKEDGA